MKSYAKIFYLSVAAALLFWPVDVLIDMMIHYEESFIEVLTDKKEVSFRILTSIFIMLFGFTVSQLFRKLSESEILVRASEERYRSLVESTEDSIYLVDRESRYIFINDEHRKRMELDGDDYMNTKYDKYHTTQETAIFKDAVDEVLSRGISVKQEHKSLRDGRYFLRTFSPVRGEDNSIEAVTVVSKDITDLKAMEDTLHNLAVTDELTGIYNRRGFFTIIHQHLKMSIRNNKALFLVYIDVDGLKNINDSFGHNEGDNALRDVADILKETYRDSDIIARIGGDEFVVVPVESDEERVEMIAKRLQDELKRYRDSDVRKYDLSISFGIAQFDPASPVSIDELLFEADKMMYVCKKGKLTR
ncbi:MAG: GGDEF domain-containing protein [Nitrospirota bacterium]|nr:MAG: GGDEF domain-containing protein [Nitrospirota bacterium]